MDIVLGIGQQGDVARRRETVFQASDDGREQRVIDIRDDDPDRERPPGLETSGQVVGLVAQGGGGGQHPRRRFGLDEGPRRLVESSRRRPGVDLGPSRHVPYCRHHGAVDITEVRVATTWPKAR